MLDKKLESENLQSQNVFAYTNKRHTPPWRYDSFAHLNAEWFEIKMRGLYDFPWISECMNYRIRNKTTSPIVKTHCSFHADQIFK